MSEDTEGRGWDDDDLVIFPRIVVSKDDVMKRFEPALYNAQREAAKLIENMLKEYQMGGYKEGIKMMAAGNATHEFAKEEEK